MPDRFCLTARSRVTHMRATCLWKNRRSFRVTRNGGKSGALIAAPELDIRRPTDTESPP